MSFFTEHDLRLLHEHGDKERAKTPDVDSIVDELKTGVWTKTKKWGEMVAGDDFRTECRRNPVKQAGRTAKQADGRYYMRRVFRPFTWAKLYRPSEKEYGIFFTVGVDGKSQSLMWKLDCKRAGTNALHPQRIHRFDEYRLRNMPAEGKATLPIAELKGMSWEELASRTRQFMADNLVHYEAALIYTWQGSKSGDGVN